jgi:hypothetical protein
MKEAKRIFFTKYSAPAGLLMLATALILQRFLKPSDFVLGLMIGASIALLLLSIVFKLKSKN